MDLVKKSILMSVFLVVFAHGIITAGHHGDENDDFKPPDLSAVIVLQGVAYSGGDSTYFAGGEKQALNGFDVRDALFVVEGEYRDYLEYNLEAGSAICTGGGLFTVMEAGVFYKFLPFLKAGITKGHVLRGFELHDECVELMTAEKPMFAKKFVPCHPIGITVEYEKEFANESSCLVQFVLAEGYANTLEDEYDINLGFQYRTPIKGLAFAGSYTHWRWNTAYSIKDSVPDPDGARDDFLYFSNSYKQVYDGYRASFGFDYNANNFLFRGEAFTGKGFVDLLLIPHYADIWKDSSSVAKTTKAPFEDLKMNAFFIQGGYNIPLKNERLKYLRPYVQYQAWDQAANLDGDYNWSFLTVGVDFGIGPGYTRFKIDYQTCLSFPSDGGIPEYNEDSQADRLMIRLQLSMD